MRHNFVHVHTCVVSVVIHVGNVASVVMVAFMVVVAFIVVVDVRHFELSVTNVVECVMLLSPVIRVVLSEAFVNMTSIAIIAIEFLEEPGPLLHEFIEPDVELGLLSCCRVGKEVVRILSLSMG